MKINVKAFLFFAMMVFAIPASVRSQDSLVAVFNKYIVQPGDSMQIEAWLEGYKAGSKPQTLNLWIDNVKTGKRWKFRYPFINGYVKFDLKAAHEIPEGIYAFNFLVQEDFYRIRGKMITSNKKDSALNYMVTARYKQPVINSVSIKGGKFEVNDIYFSDRAMFAFSAPVKRKAAGDLEISVSTPLDSAFKPAYILTEMITIGKEVNGQNSKLSEIYTFTMGGFGEGKLLENITVKGKVLSAEQQSANPVINEGDAKTIDMTKSDEHLGFPDLLSYLIYKFPNLTTRVNPETGNQYLMQRNEVVDIYVDEFIDTDFHPSSVSIQDVTMVKYFVQGLRIGGGINDNGMGGSIVIYTKRAGQRQNNKPNGHVFLLNGYSPFKGEWKN